MLAVGVGVFALDAFTQSVHKREDHQYGAVIVREMNGLDMLVSRRCKVDLTRRRAILGGAGVRPALTYLGDLAYVEPTSYRW